MNIEDEEGLTQGLWLFIVASAVIGGLYAYYLLLSNFDKVRLLWAR